VEILIAFGELTIAALILLRWHFATVWLVTFSLFIIFAIFNLRTALIGHVSCGCFGDVQVNPWLALAFDLILVGCLSLARPGKLELISDLRQNIPVLLRLGTGTALVLLILASVLYFSFGSLERAFAQIQNQPIVWTLQIDVGVGAPNTLVS
jgi:hypothetical protein